MQNIFAAFAAQPPTHRNRHPKPVTAGRPRPDNATLLRIAKYQKAFIWLFLAAIPGLIFDACRDRPFAIIIIGGAITACMYPMAKALSEKWPWLYPLLALFPLGGLIAFFILLDRAGKTLSAAGIHAGYLGVSKSDMQALAPTPPPRAKNPPLVSRSPVQRVRALAKLRDKNLISPDDFECQKQRILGEI